MMLHPIDIVVLALGAFGFWRGQKRGLGHESYRFIRALLPIAVGCGLYGLLRGGLAIFPALDPEQSGLTGLLAGAGGAFLILRRLQKRIRTYVEARFGEGRRKLAGGLGVARKFLQSSTAVLANQLTPLEGLTNSSWLGTIIERLFGT